MNYLKRKLIKHVEENLQLRQDHLKRKLNWIEENEKGEMLKLFLCEIGMQLQSLRVELSQVNQLIV